MVELTAVKFIVLVVATGLFVGLVAGLDESKIGFSERKLEGLLALLVVVYIAITTAALVGF